MWIATHAFPEEHGNSTENFKMSYKNQARGRKQAITTGAHQAQTVQHVEENLQKFRRKKESQRNKAKKKRVYSLGENQIAWIKVGIIQFQPQN